MRGELLTEINVIWKSKNTSDLEKATKEIDK